jgi:hypothetical protein
MKDYVHSPVGPEDEAGTKMSGVILVDDGRRLHQV